MRNHFASLFLSFIASVDPVRIALEADSAKWFRGVWTSGIAVAVGCVLEIWEVVVDLRNWRRHRKSLHVIPDNPGSWMYPLAALGILLVVGGIVSETVFEVLASNADAAIRSHESDVVSTAETNAAVANKQAGDANERAGKAEKQAAELLREIQPRRLSPDQVRDITDVLKPYAGKTVGVATYTQDAEAMILAVQIANSLGKARILVHNRIGTFGAMGFPLVFSVIVDKNSSDKKLESALFKALKVKGGLATFNDVFAIGNGSTMFMPPGPTHEDAFIFVGEKLLADETLPDNQPVSNRKPSSHCRKAHP